MWTPPPSGPNAQSIWAPELHRIGGVRYIYYTAAESGHDDDAHSEIFVIENKGDDPTHGSWTDRGRLKTEHTGIDGTTLNRRARPIDINDDVNKGVIEDSGWAVRHDMNE